MLSLPPIALPRDMTRGIGLIGAGGIVEHGHMPAYRKYGFNVVSICSRTEATGRAAAASWGIEESPVDWRELVESKKVQVVDVSYPFDEDRLAIVEAAAANGKHILMQKPLAHSMENARRMVEMAKKGGVVLAVNQNARWAPAYRMAKIAVERGMIGKPFFATHLMMNNQDSQPWFQSRWYAKQKRFQIMEYSVHHLDLMRYWIGREATRVRASITRKPAQASVGEMIAAIQVSFEGGALGVVTDNNASGEWASARSEFVIDGTEGQLSGEAVPGNYLKLISKAGVEEPGLKEGNWFPDSFAGTMGELMLSVEEGRESTLSGEDNLKTLGLVFEAYKDAEGVA